jgi:hypothetical protein
METENGREDVSFTTGRIMNSYMDTKYKKYLVLTLVIVIFSMIIVNFAFGGGGGST